MNIKLLLSGKGSKWKKLVQSANAELNSASLTRMIPFSPDVNHIKKFKNVCKLKEEESNSIPFLYPAVIGLYPVVCIFADPEYPFPAIGTVHVYNTTTLHRDVKENEKLAMTVKPERVMKHVKKGSEIEITSSLSDAGNNVAWTNSSKFLVMHNQRKKLDSYDVSTATNSWPDEPVEADLKLLFEEVWSLGPNASKEYAAVSLDYNPIHINTFLAKLFGFPGIIMHGMYMISRAASECQRVMGANISYPLEVSTKFTRPCVLPQKVSFKVYALKGNQKNIYFAVRGKNEKILLDGYLKAQ